MADQWDDEEDKGKSFDAASDSLLKAQEKADLEESGFDESVAGSSGEAADRIRAAIQARSADLGMEESEESKKAVEEAAERARQNILNQQSGLDLSQISDGSKEKLNVYYEPEDDMTEEEMKEADVLGQQPFLEQMSYEIGESTFPDPLAVTIKIVILAVSAVLSAIGVVNWDRAVRAFYKGQGILPTAEDIANAQQSGMQMAQELSNPTGAAAAVKAAAESAASSGLNLPDLSL